MKKFLLILVALLYLSLTSAFSQTKVGIGIGFNPIAIMAESSSELFVPIGFANVYVPIQVSSKFRLEPEIGIMNYNYNTETEKGQKIDVTNNILRYGIGGFYSVKHTKSFYNHFGIRLGMMSSTSKEEYDPEEYYEDEEKSLSAFYIGASIGGEYFLSDYFSLGAEFQLNYISFGEPEYKPEENYSNYKEYSRTYITNNGIIFARFYFN